MVSHVVTFTGVPLCRVARRIEHPAKERTDHLLFGKYASTHVARDVTTGPTPGPSLRPWGTVVMLLEFTDFCGEYWGTR